MSERILKINKLILENLNEILLREFSPKPGVFMTVTKVDTTPDLRYTRVFISVFPEKETRYVLKSLEKNIFTIQGALNKLLVMRPLPRIELRIDDTEARADEIEKLLKDIKSNQ